MLFPDVIPVSEQEVQDWLDNVPTLSALKSRREAYRKAYNIEEKIRMQKNKESYNVRLNYLEISITPL